MNRVSVLIKEKQSLINRLNNHKSLLEKAKSKYELKKINNEIQQINEKIKSIDLILDNLHDTEWTND